MSVVLSTHKVHSWCNLYLLSYWTWGVQNSCIHGCSQASIYSLYCAADHTYSTSLFLVVNIQCSIRPSATSAPTPHVPRSLLHSHQVNQTFHNLSGLCPITYIGFPRPGPLVPVTMIAQPTAKTSQVVHRQLLQIYLHHHKWHRSVPPSKVVLLDVLVVELCCSSKWTEKQI